LRAVTQQRERVGLIVPPPLWYAAGLGAAWLLSLRFPIPITPLAHVATGVACIALGIAFAASAVVMFQRSKTSVMPTRPTTALVVAGPYKYTRNPMYVGFAFAYLGIALAVNWLWALALMPVVVACVHFAAIVPEERFLEERFGPDYAEYRERVPRWL
jgi:protein-S-isoprenylcysteine O-methyltransferase Ste14